MLTAHRITARWKDRLGHVAVAALLLAALWMSYSCGSEEPKNARQTVTASGQNRPTATPRVTPVVAVSETVEPAPRTPVTFDDGNRAFNERRYDEATDMFVVYTADHPDNVWGHYMLGLSALKSGVYPQAETSFERALAIDSSHVKSLLNLARVYLDTERPEEALERIEQALNIDPELVDGYRLEGRANEELGNTDEAIEAYERAIVRDDEDAWSMNNLGLVYIRSGQFDLALRPLARAVTIRDDVPVFLNNLGIVLERMEHFGEARQAFQDAIALDGGYEKAVQNLARVETRKDEDGLVAFDLTQLADEFRQEVASWQEQLGGPVETVPPDSVPTVR